MTPLSNQLRGRPSTGGLVCFVLLVLLGVIATAAWAEESAEQTPEQLPPGLRMALERIDKLLAQSPLDLDAIQHQYLVLFENFPRREEGEKGIFALYQLLRQNKRIEQAYAVLMQIISTYQDSDTIANPAEPRKPIAIAATANIELAHLYATGMNNPYLAIDTLQRTLTRYAVAYVSVDAADRKYFGSVNVIARLQLTDYYLTINATNQATSSLLAIVSGCAGEHVRLADVETLASVAAVRKLLQVLKAMPASLPKKQRVVDTFAETAVEREARVWSLFVKAQLLADEGGQANSAGPIEEAMSALQEVLAHHALVMLVSEDGEEPAGVRALRLIADIAIKNLHNIERACADLARYYQEFSKAPGRRELAAYCLLYLAATEDAQRHNPRAAYRYYMDVVDQFSDVPFYPRKPGSHATLKILAQQEADRVHQEMR
jgi:tetratricopeptide (TPR) repeat protein